MKSAVLIAVALAASLAGARADDLLHLPQHYNDPSVPPEQSRQFWDQVVVAGKCPDYGNAVEAELSAEERTEALDACWRDFAGNAARLALRLDGYAARLKAATERTPLFLRAPPDVYLKFRDTVILTGKCEGYVRASRDQPIGWSPEAEAQANEAFKKLDDCFRDFVAPRS